MIATDIPTPQNLLSLRLVGEPQLGRGGRLVYLHSHIDRSAEVPTQHTTLWYAQAGQPAQALTHCGAGVGMGRGDASPRFSPCGQYLAFVRQHEGQGAQLMLLDLTQPSEAQPLLGGHNAQHPYQSFRGLSQLNWSPDGRYLSFVASPKRAEQGSHKAQKAQDDHPLSGEPLSDARVVKGVRLRADGQGWLEERPEDKAALWCYDCQTGALTLWLRPEYDLRFHVWQPNSSGIYAIASSSEQQYARGRAEVWSLALPTASTPQPVAKQVTQWNGLLQAVVPHPDGQRLLLVGAPEGKGTAEDPHLFLWDSTEGSAKRLDADWDYPVGNFVAGDLRLGESGLPTWISPEEVCCLYTVGGSCGVFAVHLDGQVRPLLHQPDQVISAFSLLPATTDTTEDTSQNMALSLAVVRESPSLVPEVLWDGHQITDMQSQWPALRSPVRVLHQQVEGWVLLPTSDSTQQPFPALLSIHGGPHTAYGYGCMHEFQVFAAAGYAVCYSNPRGSTGYGQVWNDAIYGQWGSVDKQDVLGFFDECLAQLPQLDRSRIGVMGGSYGGYMTNWITAHHQRFRLAITDRSICNLVSFGGTSDIGWFFWQDELGLQAERAAEAALLWDMSPLKYVERVKTPTLIVHSQADYRCPQEQAEQWYMALRKLGVPTQMLLFPEECHDLSRSGRVDRRAHRLQAYLDWFGQWL